MIHPYFGDYEELEPEEEEGEKEENKDTVTLPMGDSPLLTTSNEARKQEKNLKRDSCLSFKMAKDNVFTGKTETVGSLGSNKIFLYQDPIRTIHFFVELLVVFILIKLLS